MDFAYDHIAEQQFKAEDRATTPIPTTSSTATASNDPTTPRATPSVPRQNLQTEFQETFKAFSNSPWGATLGGFWGNVKKQSETYYEEARKEAAEVASEVEALRVKGFKGLGFGPDNSAESRDTESGAAAKSVDETSRDGEQKALDDTDTFLERFKSEAAKRLKEVQKAEDAADEALLRFGTNIRNFLRDAVAVTAPEDARQPGEIIFESKDSNTGKRVIHTSRFDAQLHVIHTGSTSFTLDPTGSGNQWEDFKQAFDIDKMTTRIAEDLDKYNELRASMEKLVPEEVDYKSFWTRYYFLRHVVDVQEEKRKELLKGKPIVLANATAITDTLYTASTHDTEEVGWDEDSEDDQDASATPQLKQSQEQPPKVLVAQNANDSSTTLHQTPAPSADPTSLKPDSSGRRSHDEKSVADSDASYDLVSGATSRAPGSPKDDASKSTTAKIDESDEEDWE